MRRFNIAGTPTVIKVGSLCVMPNGPTCKTPVPSGAKGDGQFYQPEGVAVDPDGSYIYVADALNRRIQGLVDATVSIHNPPSLFSVLITSGAKLYGSCTQTCDIQVTEGDALTFTPDQIVTSWGGCTLSLNTCTTDPINSTLTVDVYP